MKFSDVNAGVQQCAPGVYLTVIRCYVKTDDKTAAPIPERLRKQIEKQIAEAIKRAG